MIPTFDIIGAIFSFGSTVAFIKVNPLAWPLGLISISIDIFLYWHSGIYGDAILHGIYMTLTFYGWYQWLFGGNNKTELPISRLDAKQKKILVLVATIAIFIVYIIISSCTNSQIPLLDAITTVLSLIAQWLICRKIIECWILWFFIDALYVVIYFIKGLPAHSTLQIIYTGMAIAGFYLWRNRLQATKNNHQHNIYPLPTNH